MSRNLDTLLETEVQSSLIRPVWIVRLDIDTDPVYVWTGRGTLQPTGTGDSALDGYSFTGLGNIGEIGDISDTSNGSDSLKLALPGVEITADLLDQVVNNTRIWQFRQAWVWLALLNESYGVIVNPVRVKTGRIDTMACSMNGTEGRVEVEIESHQSHIGQPLGSRYSEQLDIDPTDISQKYVHDLANKQPGIGVKNDMPSYGVGGGYRWDQANPGLKRY